MIRFLLSLLLAAAILVAHDLELAIRQTPDAVIVHATYAGTDPVSHSPVEVFRTGENEPFQTGRTDRNGYFSFVPDSAGSWTLVVDDELGHRVERKIDAAEPGSTSGAATGGFTTWQKMVLGLAVILGLTGMWAWMQARRSGSRFL